MSVPQCYHWNHLEIHSHIGNVISMTLEYDYINGTSVHTTMSSGDLFKRSVCLQCTTGTNFNTVDILSMTSVKQYVTESYDTTESIPLLWFFLRDFSTLNNTNWWLRLGLRKRIINNKSHEENITAFHITICYLLMIVDKAIAI